MKFQNLLNSIVTVATSVTLLTVLAAVGLTAASVCKAAIGSMRTPAVEKKEAPKPKAKPKTSGK